MPKCLCNISGIGCKGGAGVFGPSTPTNSALSVLGLGMGRGLPSGVFDGFSYTSINSAVSRAHIFIGLVVVKNVVKFFFYFYNISQK